MAASGLWMAMNRTIEGGKFHFVTVENAAFAIENYERPVAVCRAELDETRQWDRKTHGTARLCKLCINLLEETQVPGHDQQDGTNVTYDDTALYGVGPRYGNEPVTNPGSKRTKLEAQLERHRKQAEYLENKLAKLEALPGEPEAEDGEPNVIWFSKVFQNGSTEYAYAAVKAGDGLWYTTGPNSPKGYSWERLIEWIADGKEYSLWQAATFQGL